MVGKLFNRMKVAVSGAPGTGDVTPGAAESGFLDLADAGVASGDRIALCLEELPDFELFEGTWDGSVITRDRVIASSAGGAKVNFSANAKLFGSPNHENFGQTLGYAAKTAAYAVQASDIGKLIDAASGSWSLTIPSAEEMGEGFSFYTRITTTGVITFARTGADTLDGLTSYKGYTGEVRQWISDGSVWRTVILSPFYAVITASDAGFVWPPGYLAYEGHGWGAGGTGGNGNGSTAGTGGVGAPGKPFYISAAEVTAGGTVSITIGASSAASSSIGSLVTFQGGANGITSSSSQSAKDWDGTSAGGVYAGGSGGGGGNPGSAGGWALIGGGGGGGGSSGAFAPRSGGVSECAGDGGTGANATTPATPGAAPGGGGGGGATTGQTTGAAGGRGEIRMKGVI